MFQFIKPMEPTLVSTFEDSDSYFYQLKWDGVRIIADTRNEPVLLYTRNHQFRTKIYPEITKDLGEMQIPCILDGEMVALKEGRPNFFEIMKRDRLSDTRKIGATIKAIPVYYVIFDILYFQNQWVTEWPLSERLSLLNSLGIKSPLLTICPTKEDYEEYLEFSRVQGWEGMVRKEKNSRYLLGRKHPSWQKLKHVKTLTATIIGLKVKGGAVMSVLLATCDDEFRYIGKASLGLKRKELDYLLREGKELFIDASTVKNPPSFKETIVWLKPLIKVAVQYQEWTPATTLRSPVILGLIE